MKKAHAYVIRLHSIFNLRQRHHGPLFSKQTSLQKSFPSPLTPLLPVPSHIPSLFLHLSTAYFSRHSVFLLKSVCLLWLQQLVAVLSQSLIPHPPPPTSARKDKRPGLLVRTLPPSSLRCRASAEERVTYRTGTSRLIVKKKNPTHTEWGLAGLTSCISLSTKIPGSRAEEKRGRARAYFFPVCVSLCVCFYTCHGLCFLSRLAETGHGCPGLED